VTNWNVAIEYVKVLKTDLQRFSEMNATSNNTRQELEKARHENSLLREELNNLWQNLRRTDPNAPLVYGAYTGQLANDHHPPPAHHHHLPPPPPPPASTSHGQSLPRPLIPPQTSWTPASSMMQGVEYQGQQAYDHR
jgi:hypothetical protein